MSRPGARESRIRLKMRGGAYQQRFADAAEHVPSGPRHRSPVLYSTDPWAETWPKGQGPRRSSTSSSSCSRGAIRDPEHTPSRKYRGHLCDELAADKAALDAQEAAQTAAPVVMASLFRVGDEVEHGRFGRGLVLDFCQYEVGGRVVDGLVVEFYDGRTRRFAVAAAPDALDLTEEALGQKAGLLEEAVLALDTELADGLYREMEELERQADEMVDEMAAGGLETVAMHRPYQRGDRVAHPIYGMGQVVRVRFWARTHQASQAGVPRSLVVRFTNVGLVLDLPMEVAS